MAEADSNGTEITAAEPKRNSQPSVLQDTEDIQMTDVNFNEGIYCVVW